MTLEMKVIGRDETHLHMHKTQTRSSGSLKFSDTSREIICRTLCEVSNGSSEELSKPGTRNINWIHLNKR